MDYDRKRHEQIVRAGIRTVETAEDYRDYQADKIMHEAMKLKDQGKGVTSEVSYQALVRKWADAQNA